MKGNFVQVNTISTKCIISSCRDARLVSKRKQDKNVKITNWKL